MVFKVELREADFESEPNFDRIKDDRYFVFPRSDFQPSMQQSILKICRNIEFGVAVNLKQVKDQKTCLILQMITYSMFYDL